MMNYPQWMAPYINAPKQSAEGSQGYYVNPTVNPIFGAALLRMGVNPDQSPYLTWGNQQSQSSPINQGGQTPYQYNAPSAQQMFQGMGNPMQGTMPTQARGNFGAGRFLGQGYANQTGLLGSPSTSMLGT